VIVFTPYGDPGLAPDRYNSVDAGVDQYLFREKIRVSASYFYTRMQQLVYFAPSLTPATDPFQRTSGYVNASGGLSRGAELGVEARPTSRLQLSGSYTFTNTQYDKDIEVPNFWRTTLISRHTATAAAHYQLSRRADVSFDLYHASSYFYQIFVQTAYRPFLFPGFTKADLAGGYKVWEGDRRSVRLFGKIENVFNQTYYQSGWPAPGAYGLVGLSYSF
jgi:outer membrane cobalamin receptor